MGFLDKEQKIESGLEFVLNRLEILSPFGKEEMKKIKPFKKGKQDLLEMEFENIRVVLNNLTGTPQLREIERIFHKFKDIKNSILRAERGEVLDEVELYEIKYFLILIEEFENLYSQFDFDLHNIGFKRLSGLLNILDPEGKKIPTFYIYNSYSEKLDQIRREKELVEKEIFRESDSEKKEELKRKRLDVVMKEEEEEFKVKEELSEKVKMKSSDILYDMESVAKLDLLLAKARIAHRYSCVEPVINDDLTLKIKNAKNPMIEDVLRERGKEFTPVGIELKSGVSIITGANMGGKSVTLKTIALNTMLAQMGFYVFAEEMEFSIFDYLYFISDDMQSISKGLSTFGAEIIKLKQIVESAKRKRGLIIMDEFARGTNPSEGRNLVRALCRFLKDMDSISLITTHYDGIVEDYMDHYEVVGLKNVDFESLKYKIDLNRKYSVEIIQENMDYRLERVFDKTEVPKDALNICMLLGMDENIIGFAKEYYEEGEIYA